MDLGEISPSLRGVSEAEAEEIHIDMGLSNSSVFKSLQFHSCHGKCKVIFGNIYLPINLSINQSIYLLFFLSFFLSYLFIYPVHGLERRPGNHSLVGEPTKSWHTYIRYSESESKHGK